MQRRKLSISFLGVSGYRKTNYVFEEDSTKSIYSTPLVQIAVQKHLQDFYGFNKNDRHILLLTEKARSDNYLNAKVPHNHDEAHHRGLKVEIEASNLVTPTDPIDIDFDHSQAGLFSIFDSISDQVSPGDEVYIDITHGFRSLPMLVIVLANFLSVTKQATIRKIFYGAFEDRSKFDGNTPIYDLSYLVKIDEWSSAAYSYINYGFIEPLKKLSDSEITPLLKKTKGNHDTAKTVRAIVHGSQNLAMQVRTNRGNSIYQGDEALKIKKYSTDMAQVDSDLSSPLVELVKVIAKKPQQIQKDGKLNWLIAARLAFDDNLIQQTVSLLREGLVSYVCIQNGLDQGIEKERSIAEKSLIVIGKRINRKDWEATKSDKVIIDRVTRSTCVTETATIFDQLTPLRNDLMHAGYLTESGKQARKAKGMIKSIESILGQIEGVFNITHS